MLVAANKMPSSAEQNLTVCVRIRPVSEDEMLHGATQISHSVDDNVVVLLDPMEDPDDILRANRSRERYFVYDNAFDATCTQEEVFQKTTRGLIDKVIQGYNATVFAYGATGAGKTYTMLGTDDNPGIMFRTMEELFCEMRRLADEHTFRVTLSYLEIYNEMIRDLLDPTTGYLDLREDSSRGIQVAGLSEVVAETADEVMLMLKRGNLLRTTEPTAANLTSSRSHAVLQITVRQHSRVRDVSEEHRIGKLYLIDLAGSERASNTLNRGKRMLEGAHINRSLLALGNCINALADNNTRRYVNFRDSKLTRILKEALGGNCKTVMIAHISPASFHFEESRNTLVYADRAKNIKTKLRRNVTDVNYHITQYTNIIHELRQEIFRLKKKLETTSGSVSSLPDIHDQGNSVVQKTELSILKEQLLSSFQDQMDLRYKVSNLQTKCWELNLNLQQNIDLVNKWETDKAMRVAHREEKSDNESIKKQEKLAELEGNERLTDPSDVTQAKLEMSSLKEEIIRIEKMKLHIERQLEESKTRSKTMEEILPMKVTAIEHKEILSLLCKVHELEVENTELQSESLLKDFELRKKELILNQCRNHRVICDEIIQHQSQLLQSHDIELSKDLQDLLVFYSEGLIDPVINMPGDSFLNLRSTKLIGNATASDDKDKIFSPVVLDTDGDQFSLDQVKRNTQHNAIIIPASVVEADTRHIAAVVERRRQKKIRQKAATVDTTVIGHISESPWGHFPAMSDDNASVVTGTDGGLSVWTDNTVITRNNALPRGFYTRFYGGQRLGNNRNGYVVPLQPKIGQVQQATLRNPRKFNELRSNLYASNLATSSSLPNMAPTAQGVSHNLVNYPIKGGQQRQPRSQIPHGLGSGDSDKRIIDPSNRRTQNRNNKLGQTRIPRTGGPQVNTRMRY